MTAQTMTRQALFEALECDLWGHKIERNASQHAAWIVERLETYGVLVFPEGAYRVDQKTGVVWQVIDGVWCSVGMSGNSGGCCAGAVGA